jgi:hypothetical protein
VAGSKQGSLQHMHKSRIDFPEPDIQAVKRGFLPSMSAVSPDLPVQELAANDGSRLAQNIRNLLHTNMFWKIDTTS